MLKVFSFSQKYSKILFSAQSLKEFQPIMAAPEPRPYTPSSYRQPPPERYRPDSRSQTMQSQHGEFSMRRTPSYDSRQFNAGGEANSKMDYNYYDQGDMPKHIR